VRLCAFLSLAVLVLALGCNKAPAPNDAQISSDIQNKLSSDSGLAGKQLGGQSGKRVGALSGVVGNDGQREAAGRYASSEAGVTQVVNNLTVTPQQAMAAPPAETQPQSQPQPQSKPMDKPKAGKHHHHDEDAASNDNSAPPSQNAANSTPP